MAMQIRILRSGDESILRNVAAGVFDHAIHMQTTTEFLDDPRHHLVVAKHLTPKARRPAAKLGRAQASPTRSRPAKPEKSTGILQ